MVVHACFGRCTDNALCDGQTHTPSTEWQDANNANYAKGNDQDDDGDSNGTVSTKTLLVVIILVAFFVGISVYFSVRCCLGKKGLDEGAMIRDQSVIASGGNPSDASEGGGWGTTVTP